MHKVFVESKVITAGDFDLCWPKADLSSPPNGVVEPFIQLLADKGILPIEKSLKLLTDKARVAYLPLEKYDIDLDLARSFPSRRCPSPRARGPKLRFCRFALTRCTRAACLPRNSRSTASP